MRLLVKDWEITCYKNLMSTNKIEINWIWFYKILKYIGKFVVNLKTINYKKYFFYYLSFMHFGLAL